MTNKLGPQQSGRSRVRRFCPKCDESRKKPDSQAIANENLVHLPILPCLLGTVFASSNIRVVLIKAFLSVTATSIAFLGATLADAKVPAIAADSRRYEKQFINDECVAHAMQVLKALGFMGIVQHKVGAFGFTPTTPAEFSAVIRCETAVKTVFFVVTGVEQSDETVRILRLLIDSFENMPR